MSPKELLYIEDALGHAQHMEKKCRQCATQIQDEELKQLGAKEGDTVCILDQEFEYEERLY